MVGTSSTRSSARGRSQSCTCTCTCTCTCPWTCAQEGHKPCGHSHARWTPTMPDLQSSRLQDGYTVYASRLHGADAEECLRHFVCCARGRSACVLGRVRVARAGRGLAHRSPTKVSANLLEQGGASFSARTGRRSVRRARWFASSSGHAPSSAAAAACRRRCSSSQRHRSRASSKSQRARTTAVAARWRSR